MQKKVFVIGFNKTGTTSLTNFFKKNNISACHWKGGNLAINIVKNIRSLNDPLSGYEEYTVFTDMEYVSHGDHPLVEGYKYFKDIYAWHPDAKFILNTRDVEKWIASREKHGNYIERYRRHYGVGTLEEVRNLWRIDFYSHHAEVIRFFHDKPGKLLIFNIEKDSNEKLVEFLGDDYSIKNFDIPHSNKTKR